MIITKHKKLCVLLFALAALSGNCMADSDPQNLQGEMRAAFDSMTVLVDEAIGREQGEPVSAEFRRALDALQASTGAISLHGSSMPQSFAAFSSTLGESTNQMIRSYNTGIYEIGDTYLVEVIDHCAACHTQYPLEKGNFDSIDFADRIADESLNPDVSTRIMIAARQPEKALEVWDKYLSRDEFSLALPGSETYLLEYLFQALHLGQPTSEIAALLDQLSESEDTPFFMTRKIGVWNRQLGILDAVDSANLERGMIGETYNACRDAGQREMEYGYPVCQMIVSRLAHELLRANPDMGPEESASLFLAVANARIDLRLSASQVPPPERFLEAAIRTAPDSEVARDAYARIEELGIYFYSDLDLADEIMGVSFSELRELAGISE